MSGRSYEEFLAAKVPQMRPAGKEPGPVHESLFPFQRHIVEWACRLGRAAVFADCGLGKTRIQLEWARLMGERALILAPLAVNAQTKREGDAIGVDVTICRGQQDVTDGINIANYEMLEHFDPGAFGAIVLDESSILKAFMGKTKRRLMEAFRDTPFKLCCTATPAPNDHLELGNHADFLNVMRSNEMISRFFINDSMQAGNYRLKRHAEGAFWRWVHSWAASLEKPSDLGDYSDDGFVLPPLTIRKHVVHTEHDPTATGTLFRIPTMSATSMHREMRHSAADRAQMVAAIVSENPGPWVIWCNTNYEADELRKAIPEAGEVRGSDTMADKETRLLGFVDGAPRVLITKPTIAGFGMNWQHCPNAAFVGLSYSYEQFYQATRRIWRFGQRLPVTAHIVAADTEGNVLETIERKERDHQRMKTAMNAAMREVQRGEAVVRNAGFERRGGVNWRLFRGDSVEVLREAVEDNSVGLSVFSPPFSNLYIYSDHAEDMGNSRDHEEFFRHFRFVIDELFRATTPGRICAVHCKDLPLYMGRDGAAGLYDFPGRTIREFEAAGWTYHSRVTIWKSPVTEMQRTKNHGLLYKQLRKDSAASRQGMADYLLAFRKWTGEAGWSEFPDPVTHTREDFPLEQWQEWASPVWFDVEQMNVLQYRGARGDKDERHICPLQLDVIERAIALWSNPGDLVLSPFAGIGSEGYQALRMGRRFVGVELKEEYFDVACKYLASAAQQVGADLFEGNGVEEATA